MATSEDAEAAMNTKVALPPGTKGSVKRKGAGGEGDLPLHRALGAGGEEGRRLSVARERRCEGGGEGVGKRGGAAALQTFVVRVVGRGVSSGSGGGVSGGGRAEGGVVALPPGHDAGDDTEEDRDPERAGRVERLEEHPRVRQRQPQRGHQNQGVHGQVPGSARDTGPDPNLRSAGLNRRRRCPAAAAAGRAWQDPGFEVEGVLQKIFEANDEADE